MHIGIDVSRLAVGQRTGTEHYTWEILQALGQVDRDNHYTLYANHRPAALPPLPPRFQLRTMPWPRLWTHVRLSAEMLYRAPDVLFVPAHVLPLVHPRRSVVTIHDLGYMHYPTAHPAAQRLYLRYSTWWSAQFATHLLADSEATKRDLLHFCHSQPDKVSVVYLGVSPRFMPVVDAKHLSTVTAKYGVVSPYLLYVGTIQPRKNLVRLIDACAMAHLDGVQLVLAGKRGWLTQEIEARASSLGITHQVHFTGYVADDDLPALISGARGFLLPSLYEGFGLPALEAMACGTPVLASVVSSLPEVIGDAGILVDPLDVAALARGLDSLVHDDDLHAVLRARGLTRVAPWSWQRCAKQTLSILEMVAATTA
ncbi:MAG: glycosyltransferase family 4 protein [Herpetosiphonaceae bacterium]|nr:glycosyltransferase family 4 protein [Herpetosiphonaceae bacterium]